MADFFTQVAARALKTQPAVRAVAPSVFAPEPRLANPIAFAPFAIEQPSPVTAPRSGDPPAAVDARLSVPPYQPTAPPTREEEFPLEPPARRKLRIEHPPQPEPLSPRETLPAPIPFISQRPPANVPADAALPVPASEPEAPPKRNAAPPPAIAAKPDAPAGESLAPPRFLRNEPIEPPRVLDSAPPGRPTIQPPPQVILSPNLTPRPRMAAIALPPSEPHTIHVTIGRVEVRAVLPPSPARPAQPHTKSELSLDDYLRRKGGRR